MSLNPFSSRKNSNSYFPPIRVDSLGDPVHLEPFQGSALFGQAQNYLDTIRKNATKLAIKDSHYVHFNPPNEENSYVISADPEYQQSIKHPAFVQEIVHTAQKNNLEPKASTGFLVHDFFHSISNFSNSLKDEMKQTVFDSIMYAFFKTPSLASLTNIFNSEEPNKSIELENKLLQVSYTSRLMNKLLNVLQSTSLPNEIENNYLQKIFMSTHKFKNILESISQDRLKNNNLPIRITESYIAKLNQFIQEEAEKSLTASDTAKIYHYLKNYQSSKYVKEQRELVDLLGSHQNLNLINTLSMQELSRDEINEVKAYSIFIALKLLSQNVRKDSTTITLGEIIDREENFNTKFFTDHFKPALKTGHLINTITERGDENVKDFFKDYKDQEWFFEGAKLPSFDEFIKGFKEKNIKPLEFIERLIPNQSPRSLISKGL